MDEIKTLAIYLPQYHPIPENSAAWGEGFTEWTNVRKAVPRFEGHYQPHEPDGRLGYYDLQDPEVLCSQAKLARDFGVYGFAFYHYWFHGEQLLQTPVENMLNSGRPDFPFCLIWANENWTKKWDGQETEIIKAQKYSREDDLEHIRYLCKHVFCDPRYIKIDEKPLFIIYRTELFPEIKNTAHIWREEAKAFGFKDLFLVRVESFVTDIIPSEIGFDAAMEFTPGWHDFERFNSLIKTHNGFIEIDYSATVLKLLSKKTKNYIWFRTVFPGWDNTARKANGGIVFNNNSSEMFRHYISRIMEYTRTYNTKNSKIFFINAWNEWGEGCHLEPDLKFGTSFLKAILDSKNASSTENMTAYIEYLEEKARSNNENAMYFENLALTIDSIYNSDSYRLAQILLKPVKLIRRFIK